MSLSSTPQSHVICHVTSCVTCDWGKARSEQGSKEPEWRKSECESMHHGCICTTMCMGGTVMCDVHMCIDDAYAHHYSVFISVSQWRCGEKELVIPWHMHGWSYVWMKLHMGESGGMAVLEYYERTQTPMYQSKHFHSPMSYIVLS